MELTGGCACGSARYKLKTAPMFVHACHCTDCQRATGSAFLINMIIHSDDLVIEGPISKATLETSTGAGRDVHYCSECATNLWTKYHFIDLPLLAVSSGTLDTPNNIKPLAHMFTRSKQPWMVLDNETPQFPEEYDPAELWPEEGLRRLQE